MTHAIDVMVSALQFLFVLVMGAVGFVDVFLAGLMTSAGVPPQAQVIVLIGMAVLVVVAAIRLLGPVLAMLIVILLVLLLLHRVLPGALPAGHFPSLQLPGALQEPPGTVHT